MVKAFRPSSPPNDNISTTVPLQRRPINQHVPENICNIPNCFLRTSPPPHESMSESSRRPKVITCQIPVRITNRNIKSRYNSKQANFNNLKEVKTLYLLLVLVQRTLSSALVYCLRIPCLYYLKSTKFVVLSMRKIQTWSVLLKHGYMPLLLMNISSYLDITLCSKTVPLSYTGCVYIYKELDSL